ncbi:MAG: YciI family protein [Chloroflexota bacterium]
MPNYIYLIHPLREEFFQFPTDEENTAMEEHYQYLKSSLLTGQVLLAGPCLDETFGLVIFQAEDESSANAFMMNDPSIQKNVMMAELHPFSVSICRDQ